MATTSALMSSGVFNLRQRDMEPVLVRVERTLGTQLDRRAAPRDLTRNSRIEDEETGPGGIYARLEDTGHTLVRFIEQVRVRPATQHEADQLTIPTGAPVSLIQRTAHASHRAGETNLITAAADWFELRYELPAD